MITASAITAARAASVWSSRQIPMSKNDSGLKPRTSSPATAIAANTASTDVRPSSAQYTSCKVQDQCVLVEHQRRADPEKDCRHGEFGYSPVDRQSHHRHAGDHHQDHTDHHVVDVQATDAEMLRGCHHLRGLSLSAWLRM